MKNKALKAQRLVTSAREKVGKAIQRFASDNLDKNLQIDPNQSGSTKTRAPGKKQMHMSDPLNRSDEHPPSAAKSITLTPKEMADMLVNSEPPPRMAKNNPELYAKIQQRVMDKRRRLREEKERKNKNET